MGDGSDVNEFSTLLLDVAMKRKHLPAACSKMLSNTLKIEINNLAEKPSVLENGCLHLQIEKGEPTVVSPSRRARPVTETGSSEQAHQHMFSLFHLKVETFILQNVKYPTVEVDSCVYNSDTWCISEKLKEDIAKSVHNINMLDPFSKVEGILQESRSVIRVLDQIQKEKTCEMDIRLRTLKQHL